MNFTNKAAPAPQKIYSDTYRVGLGYSVRFIYSPGAWGVERIDAEWMPFVPSRGALRRVNARYVQARNSFFADLCKRLGMEFLGFEEAEQ